MSELASFLAPQLESLVERWTERIAQGLAPSGASEPVLRDHIKDVLRELVVTLHHGSVPDTIIYARKHGQQRYEKGFDLDAMVREYGVLRGLILELSEQARLGLTMTEIRLLTDFIAEAIAEAVTEYDRHRAQAEQRLTQTIREHEAQLWDVLESTAEGIWGVNLGGLCTFANPAAARMLGVSSAADLLGQNLLGPPYQGRGPGDRTLAHELTEVLRTGRVARGDDLWMERRDGTVFPLRYSISPQRRGGEVTGAVVTFEDITERKKAEEVGQLSRVELEAERAKLRDLFMQSTAAIAILEGPEHRFSFANPAYRALVGGREVVGKSVLEALPELRGQGFDTLLDRVVATREPFVGNEVPVQLDRTGSGHLEEAFLNFTYSPKHDAHGQVDGVLVSAVDVTLQARSRQQVEALVTQLRASEERLQLFVDASGAGTWELNPTTHEVVADRPFRSFFGLSPDESFDLSGALALMPPEDRAHVAHLVQEALTGKNDGRYVAEHRVLREPEPTWMEVRGQAFFDSAGQVTRFLGTGVDITDRKRTEQEREHLVEELTRSNQSLDQFAHVASHDLRAPLRGIASLTDWLEEDLGEAITPDVRDKLVLMRSRVQRLEALIVGILDFATAGRTQTKPEPVDVGQLLSEAIELLAPPAHIAITVAAGMPTLVVERVPLQQVFMNLLGNAIKHTQQPGAAIRVEATPEGPNVHFRVVDNGPGIAPEHHERIWGIFQKLETRAKVEGTGIGLAVVKKIVESRGGKTWVESAEGQGATFHVLWPRRLLSLTLGAPASTRGTV